MHELILWSAFLGGWLLFAGPLYQAAQELEAEEVSREEIEKYRDVQVGDRPSAWWWLIPPLGYLKQHRFQQRQYDALVATMPAELLTNWVSFINKATGWFYVAAGAFLIALKETYELVEEHHWPTAVFWVLVVVMAALAIVNTAARINRTHVLVRES